MSHLAAGSQLKPDPVNDVGARGAMAGTTPDYNDFLPKSSRAHASSNNTLRTEDISGAQPRSAVNRIQSRGQVGGAAGRSSGA